MHIRRARNLILAHLYIHECNRVYFALWKWKMGFSRKRNSSNLLQMSWWVNRHNRSTTHWWPWFNIVMLNQSCFNVNEVNVSCHISLRIFPAGTWRRNDDKLTSMRRQYVASTSVRRRYDVMCQLRFDISDKTEKKSMVCWQLKVQASTVHKINKTIFIQIIGNTL